MIVKVTNKKPDKTFTLSGYQPQSFLGEAINHEHTQNIISFNKNRTS